MVLIHTGYPIHKKLSKSSKIAKGHQSTPPHPSTNARINLFPAPIEPKATRRRANGYWRRSQTPPEGQPAARASGPAVTSVATARTPARADAGRAKSGCAPRGIGERAGRGIHLSRAGVASCHGRVRMFTLDASLRGKLPSFRFQGRHGCAAAPARLTLQLSGPGQGAFRQRRPADQTVFCRGPLQIDRVRPRRVRV